MSQPYVGEIRIFAGNFAPVGWSFCNGSLLSISENDVLFNLIGTTYGGDGQSTFALPNLQGRVPIHQGTSPTGSTYVMGQMAGSETVTLATSQLPAHSHTVAAANTGGSDSPAGKIFGASTVSAYSQAPPNATMNPASTGITGGNQSHDNMLPFLAINFIISFFGIYPSQG